MSWRQSHRLETHSEATLQTASSFQLPLDTEAVSTRLGGQHSCRAGRNRADAEPRGSNLWCFASFTMLHASLHLYISLHIALVCLSPEVFGFIFYHAWTMPCSTGPWGSNQSSTAPGPVARKLIWRWHGGAQVELQRGSRRSWSSKNHRGDGAPHLLLHGGLAAKVLVCLGTLAARGWVSHSQSIALAAAANRNRLWIFSGYFRHKQHLVT